MGKIIGEIQAANPSKQIIVSTHSGDFLRGIIESKAKKLKVARISRVSSDPKAGEVNNLRVLDSVQLEALWCDPVLRFSNSLDAVFHEGCIICEHEADCSFFSAVAKASLPSRRDIMYLGTGGKGGMKKLVDSLCALGVPVGVITDFDILNSIDPLKKLYELLGGKWESVSKTWEDFQKEVKDKNKSPPKKKSEVTRLLESREGEEVSPETAKEITDLLKLSSAWDEPKRLGLKYFQGGTLAKAKELVDALAKVKIYAVPEGEMEGFVPEFRTDKCKGSSWVAKVLREIDDLEKDGRLSAARAFVKKVYDGFAQG